MTQSKYFVRFNKLEQVNKSVDLLSEAAGHEFEKVSADAYTFKYYAPDGDVVFEGLKTKNGYICRFHSEVFTEDRETERLG